MGFGCVAALASPDTGEGGTGRYMVCVQPTSNGQVKLDWDTKKNTPYVPGAVVVKDHADTAHQAIHAAVSKLKRAVISALSKQDPRRSGSLPDDPALDATDDFPR